ncbi:MAG: phospholipid carrier-dependent glycosyltransferase [Roseburia sp.]|nr:phospholipid carrier-dependent glycosyltransferase [Roseburia sp.]
MKYTPTFPVCQVCFLFLWKIWKYFLIKQKKMRSAWKHILSPLLLRYILPGQLFIFQNTVVHTSRPVAAEIECDIGKPDFL